MQTTTVKMEFGVNNHKSNDHKSNDHKSNDHKSNDHKSKCTKNSILAQLNRVVLPGIILLGLATSALAQPVAKSIDLRAIRIGESNQLTFSGSGLEDDSRIISDFKIQSQSATSTAAGKKLVVEIVPEASTPPGLYAIRLLNARGISSPILISVDHFQNEPFAEKVAQAPVALHGQLRGAQILKTTVSGKAGQRLMVEVEGKRIGSSIRPVLRIYDPKLTQFAWSGRLRELDGDARLDVTLPETGQYTIEMHDVLYRSPGDSFFRLKIGDIRYADLAYPVAVTRDSPATMRFPGSNLKPDQEIKFQSPSLTGWHSLALTDDDLLLSTTPRVLVTDHPQLIESEIENAKIIETIPVGVSGLLSKPGEVDRFNFKVKPGQLLRFEILADRIGSPVDGKLVVKDAKGEQLAQNDDQETTSDPAVQYRVPDGTESVSVEVTDITAAGSPANIYLLQVTDKNAPDFSLSASTDAINLPANGTIMIRIDADRQGYDGPIDIEVQGLPENVQVSGNTIVAGSKFALLSLSSDAQPLSNNSFSIVGVGAFGKDSGEVRREAKWMETPVSRRLPWLRKRFSIASAGKPAIDLQLNGDFVSRIYPGGEVRGQFKLKRDENAKGKVRIRMETDQTIPQKKIREDNKDKVVDDVERTLRLGDTIEFVDAKESSGYRIMVPNDLPEREWAVSFVAELLSADEKQVLQRAFVPTIVVPAKRAFTIKATSERRIEISSEDKEADRVSGEVTRGEGFEGPVTVSLTGLPEKVNSATVLVPKDMTTFELPIKLTGEFKPEDLKNVYMIGKSISESDGAHVIASSNRVKLSLAVSEKAAEPTDESKKATPKE